MPRTQDGPLGEAYVAARRLGSRAARRAKKLAGRVPTSRKNAPIDPRLKSYAYAYRRLLGAVYDLEPKDVRRLSFSAPPPEDIRTVKQFVRRIQGDAELGQRLQRGEPFAEAVVGSVRTLVANGDHVAARALAQALQDNPETASTGHLASALVALQRGLVELAWSDFQAAGHDAWFEHAPVEYVRTAFLGAPDQALVTCREMLEAKPELLDAQAWAEMAFSSFGVGEIALAGELLDQAGATPGEPLTEVTRKRADWLRPWIQRALSPQPAPEVPPGHVSFGVLDYDQPDYQQVSTNLGDYVQTLAAMGHVVRHQGLRFDGDPELAELLTQLQGRVKPGRRVDTVQADVTLVRLNRDATNLDAIPERTWAIAFGWYMQSQFKMRHDFPFHENLRPIFISFHVNRRDMLTPAAIEYLKAHGPIGCRDWTTVDLLLSCGVPAFFSGCITTTVDTVFPEDPTISRIGKPTAYVDVKADNVPKADRRFRSTQADEAVRVAPFGPNMRDAMAMLERYRRDFGHIVTTRLHCYLPSRSLGVEVDFVPRNRADIRFNGLLDLTDQELDTMRSGIRDFLLPVLEVMFSGASDEEVYARWREATADAVEVARLRRETVPPLSAPSFDVGQACKVVQAERADIVRSTPGPDGDEIHVALALDENLREQLLVVLDGLVQHASRPLHFWVLSRGHGATDHQRLAEQFPTASFTWLPCDAVDYGPVLGMLKHITVSTMDRLLLPDLLPELSKVVYHDIDALCLTDIAPLYDTDVEGRPLAARSSIARGTVSGFGNIYLSGKRLEPEEAFDLYRRMHARFDFDFVSFNAGILVLNLEHMRQDDFCREFVPFVEHYGMNDQEVLNCYAGPNRVVIDPRWNSIAAQEPVTDPWIVHWAGPSKPWGKQYILFQHEWQRQEQHLQGNAPSPVDG